MDRRQLPCHKHGLTHYSETESEDNNKTSGNDEGTCKKCKYDDDYMERERPASKLAVQLMAYVVAKDLDNEDSLYGTVFLMLFLTELIQIELDVIPVELVACCKRISVTDEGQKDPRTEKVENNIQRMNIWPTKNDHVSLEIGNGNSLVKKVLVRMGIENNDSGAGHSGQ
eukprot:scaffold35698_cov63-Attheya_sp.AAC.14